MIFTKGTAQEQIDMLLLHYKELKISAKTDDLYTLQGWILVNRVFNDFTVCKRYEVEINIPIESDRLPYIRELSGAIDKRYPHRYISGELCLETDANIRIRFLDGFNLLQWMEEYVELYFFSYEYYKVYGIFPFGERGHGIQGVLETYGEIFGEKDPKKILSMMQFVLFKGYRGHLMCPCGSGRKLRNCHGGIILKFMDDIRLKNMLQNDFKFIEREVMKYGGQHRNPK